MKLIIQQKKIQIKEETKIWNRYKTFKFYLEKIDFGIKLSHKKTWSTYFFCQNVDICVTNKENKIIELYENVTPERRKFLWKAHNIYYLPINSCRYLKIGEKIKEEK